MKKNNTYINIAIYARKSKFVEQSESINNQILICKEYIGNNFSQYNLSQYKDDGYTGKNSNRPDFRQLISDINSGKINCVVAYKLDRIYRNAAEFYKFLDLCSKKKVDFITVKDSFNINDPIGKAMAGIQAVLAELERNTTSERISDNMYAIAKSGSGRWLGGKPPFGYKLKKEFINNKMYSFLVEDEREINIVKLLFDKFLEVQSLTALQKFTYNNHISGSKSKVLDISSLGLILKNPVYTKSTTDVIDYLISNRGMYISNKPDGHHGIITYGKTNNKQTSIASVSKHLGVIDGNVWLEVQSILEKNSTLFPRQKTGKKALLSGLIKCKSCGKNMRVSYKKSKNDTIEHYYYICGTKKKFGKDACNCSNLPGKYLDDLIVNEIINLDINSFIKNYNKYYKLDSNTSANEITLLSNTIKSSRSKLDRLTRRLDSVDDDIIAESILSNMKAISDEIKELKIKLESLQSSTSLQDDSILNNIITDINNFKQFYLNASMDSKRNLLNNIINKIEWNSLSEEINILYNI